MASLNTAFKKVYTEALEPYGFKKIKGRQPYFVRMVGDEIVHIITVIPEPTIMPGERRYGIYGGVATVYRPRINLDITPRNNSYWLRSTHSIYRDADVFANKPDRFMGKYMYVYEKDNEKSLVASVKHSVKGTKQVLLEELDKVKNLEACIQYMIDFTSSLLVVIDDGEFGKMYECNEGLVNFKVFNRFDEFVQYRKKRSEKYDKEMLYMIKTGMCGLSMESFRMMKKRGEKNRQSEMEIFEKYLGNDNNHEKVMEEMERRKRENLQILRNYGLDV